MRQFTLSLNERYQRPIVKLDSWYGLHALLDTGAVLPIWTKDESILCDLGGKHCMKNVPFGGFGGMTTGNLYTLPSMSLGSLIFPNLPIIAANDLGDVPFYMILSATMFSGLIYEIDNQNCKLNITIPSEEDVVRNIKVTDSHGRIHILCDSGPNTLDQPQRMEF